MNRRCRNHGAFTLLETLSAVVILTFLVVVVASILGQVNAVWVRAQGQSQQQQSGRSLINFLARDISQALMPVNTSNTGGLQLMVNSSALTTGSYALRDNIFFQAPVATNTAMGEVAEVGYFVQWQGQTAQLCRFFANPNDTTNFQIYANPTAWLTPAYVSAVAPATSPSYQGLLAENVIGLWINAYDKNGNPYFTSAVRTYDSRNPPTAASSGNPNPTYPPYPSNPPNLPAFVDISVLILDPAGAKRVGSGAVSVSTLQALVQSSSYTNAAQCLGNLPFTLRQGANCFSTRVHLINSQ